MSKINSLDSIVLKVGSSLTTLPSGRPNLKFIKSICNQIYQLNKKKFKVVLVSSGAIAQGMKIWNLTSKPDSIDYLQALSASGQIGLVNSYQKEFKKFNLIAAQVLLSHSDFKVKKRSENAKKSILNLIKLGAIPIINENDSISTEEIKYGDNDRLSGKVASLLDAKKLIILTDQEGLFNKNPEENQDAVLIKKLNIKNFNLGKISFGKSGIFGRGGMRTKIQAAQEFLTTKKEVRIVNGGKKDSLVNLIKTGKGGTKIYLS